MRQVVFLYNELMNKSYQEKLKLPLEFICFAYIEGAIMYDIKGKYYALKENSLRKTKGYNRVYGALYILHNSEHFLRTLDASLVCSRGIIGKNHKLDVMHRTKEKAIPIHFKTVEEFLKMKYNEGDGLDVITYIANPENELIKSNVINTVRNREVCGLDINNFIDLLLKEVSDEEENKEN